jgi:predicted RNase H-like HicB family nuclease
MLFTAITSREEKHYVALAPDVDIASQGETIEEALANLKEALELYFEDDDSIRPPLTSKPIVTRIDISQ